MYETNQENVMEEPVTSGKYRQRVNTDHIEPVRIQDEEVRGQRKIHPVFRFLCYTAVVITGLLTYEITGFRESINSMTAHAVIGGSILGYFLIMFRAGLYSQ